MIVQNGTEDSVINSAALEEDDGIKTAAFEDDEIEFNTKEDAVDYAYVTIATVYMSGLTQLHVSRKKLPSSVVENELRSDNLQ